MKVTVEGTRDQVADGVRRLDSVLSRARPGASVTARNNERIAADYKLLGDAFRLIRRDPEQAETAARLLAGISDLSKRTPALRLEAQAIVDAKPN